MTPTPRRVLVVDDEASNLTFVERVLSSEGYDVIGASDGPEALRVVERERPFDLFLLDVVMPQMQGDELARQIRQSNPDAKILYFTGYADRLFESRHQLWEHEAFIEKPVSVTGLLEAVSLMLTGRIGGLSRNAR